MAQNAQSVITRLPVKLTTASIRRTLDLSSIIDKLDTYPTNSRVFFDPLIVLDDLAFGSLCVPNTDCSKLPSNVPVPLAGIYFRVASVAPNIDSDFRNLYVSLEYGNRRIQMIQPVNKFKFKSDSVWGWADAITHSDLRKYPILQLTLKLVHDTSVVQKIPQYTLKQQYERMHQLSAEHGDITLKIKLHQQDDESDILYSPPQKKRRLNQEYECTVCNKQFADNKALKTHELNTKDEAHENCRIDGNHNNAENLDDDEIKISSVILRSASKVFDRMLSANMMEREQKTIEINAKRVADINDLTYYMSTNILKSNCNPFNLIELAKLYMMDRLFWECVNRIIKNINVENFAQSVNVFSKYEIEDGYESLVEFAKKNIKQIKQAPDFDKIPFIFKRFVFKK